MLFLRDGVQSVLKYCTIIWKKFKLSIVAEILSAQGVTNDLAVITLPWQPGDLWF